MPIPRLLHPTSCTIRRINRNVTKFDSVAREPVRQLWRAGDAPGTGDEVNVNAIVNWNEGKYRKPKENKGAGVEFESDGYLLVRVADLLADGIATDNGDGTLEFGFSRGDRITRIGRRKLNLFVTFFRDVAHWPDQMGATLLEINFAERSPSECSVR